MATKSWKEEITDELLSFATENQAAKIALANLLDFVEEDKQGDNHETR